MEYKVNVEDTIKVSKKAPIVVNIGTPKTVVRTKPELGLTQVSLSDSYQVVPFAKRITTDFELPDSITQGLFLDVDDLNEALLKEIGDREIAIIAAESYAKTYADGVESQVYNNIDATFIQNATGDAYAKKVELTTLGLQFDTGTGFTTATLQDIYSSGVTSENSLATYDTDLQAIAGDNVALATRTEALEAAVEGEDGINVRLDTIEGVAAGVFQVWYGAPQELLIGMIKFNSDLGVLRTTEGAIVDTDIQYQYLGGFLGDNNDGWVRTDASAVESANIGIDNIINVLIPDLQGQLDGEITTWFDDYVPDILTLPWFGWDATDTINGNTVEQDRHLGDIFYNTATGQGFRFTKVGPIYSWGVITDDATAIALANAAAAQDTADGKRRVFILTPTVPYDAGDLWSEGPTGDLRKCVTPKTVAQLYDIADWELASKYTDDTFASQIQSGARQIDLSEHINALGWTDDTSIDDFITVTYATDKIGLTGQLDGKASSYFSNILPYAAEEGTPARDGDTWYNIDTHELQVYHYDASTPSWDVITDPYIQGAYDNAATAQTTADGKIQNFTSTPFHPYYSGDTWMEGVSGDIYVCITPSTGSYNIAHWVIASKYTDDTTTIQLQTGLANGSVTIDLSSSTIDGTTSIIDHVGAEIDGLVVVYSGVDHTTQVGMSANDIYIEKAVDESGAVPVDVTNTYIYNGTAWDVIGNNDNLTALADLADGKRSIFSGILPTGMITEDIWIPSLAPTDGTKIIGEIYIYDGASWQLATKYSADIVLLDIEIGVVDGKVDDEEQARITALLAEQTARVTAINERIAKEALLDGRIDTEEITRAQLGTDLTIANEDYTDTVAQALIDGEITDAEAAAIAEAQIRVNTAQTALQNNIDTNQDLFDDFVAVIVPDVTTLQNQVDGKIEYWFLLSTAADPAIAWTTAVLREQHHGDVKYFTDTRAASRYSDSLGWYAAEELNESLQQAAQAQTTADGKATIYYQGNPPTGLTASDAGDRWIDSDTAIEQIWTGTIWADATSNKLEEAAGWAAGAAKFSGPVDVNGKPTGPITGWSFGSAQNGAEFVSEFAISADHFYLDSASDPKYRPFEVDTPTGEISFRGKVEFSSVKNTPASGSVINNYSTTASATQPGWSGSSAVASPLLEGFSAVRSQQSRDAYGFSTDAGPGYQFIPLSPGEKIGITGWVRTLESILPARVGVRRSINGVAQSNWPTVQVASIGQDWTYFEVSMEGAAGYTGFTPFTQVPAVSFFGTVYWADIQYTRSVSLTGEEIVASVNSAVTTIDGPRISTGSITTTQLKMNTAWAGIIYDSGTVAGNEEATYGMKIDLDNGEIHIR